jgi:hypothetical protein
MYHVINIQTHYHEKITEKIKNHWNLPISRRFLTGIWLPSFKPHPLSPATELSAKFRPYSTEFWAKADDFWTRRPPSIACSSGGTTTLTGVLFCRHGEKKYPPCASWAKWTHFVIFDLFWILINKTSYIWRNFFTSDLKILSSFFYVFQIFYFFKKIKFEF